MRQERFYVTGSDGKVQGPMSKSMARIAQTADPGAKMPAERPAPSAPLGVLAGM